MDNLEIGDLVMVITPSPCCNGTKYLGLVGTIRDMVPANEFVCRHCLAPAEYYGPILYAVDDGQGTVRFSRSELKKIPPLTEEENEQTNARTPVEA